jgi:hypothetical protein
MGLLHEQRIIETLKLNPDIKGIRILTTSKNFEERYEGSISYFFRCLKNGLGSFQSISNRKFFKNLSGCYFTLEDSNEFEIIILYDSSISKLNRIQVVTRIRKLLGLGITVEFGDFETYESRIREMVGIVRRTQTFGNFYFSGK